MIVDLFPDAHRLRWESLEAACEHIEACSRPFSLPSVVSAIGRSPRNFGAARQAIRALLAVDLIARISPPGARPVYYVRSDKPVGAA